MQDMSKLEPLICLRPGSHLFAKNHAAPWAMGLNLKVAAPSELKHEASTCKQFWRSNPPQNTPEKSLQNLKTNPTFVHILKD